MKQQSIINNILFAKPNVVFLIGFLILLIVAILGELFCWIKIPFSPYSNIIGGVIAVFGFGLHLYCHRIHKQAHKKSEHIDKIITTGIFSKIRHPMYLSMILAFIGISIAWGVVWMLIPSVLFSILAVLIAIKEEEYLLQKFGSQYEEYMRKVPWRFIAKVF